MNKSLLYTSVFSAYVGLAGGSIVHKDPLKGVDIEKEYELIKNKKSPLSASMRRAVEIRYKQLKENDK